MKLDSGHFSRRVRIFGKGNRGVCRRTAFYSVISGEIRPTHDVERGVRSRRTDTDIAVGADVETGNVGGTEVGNRLRRRSVRDIHPETEISRIRTFDPSGVIRIRDAPFDFEGCGGVSRADTDGKGRKDAHRFYVIAVKGHDSVIRASGAYRTEHSGIAVRTERIAVGRAIGSVGNSWVGSKTGRRSLSGNLEFGSRIGSADADVTRLRHGKNVTDPSGLSGFYGKKRERSARADAGSVFLRPGSSSPPN